ncbi:MAG: SDR family oxidoreductase [Cyanobacteria bacterium P01_F01_bin.33]
MIDPSDNDRLAWVTGASRGIGRAVALKLAERGIPLALIARSKSDLEQVALDVERLGGKSIVFPVDLSQIAVLPQQLEQVLALAGPCRLLINNAGMGYTANAVDTPVEDWQRTLDLNLTAAWLCMKAVIPGMRDRGGGTIANVISIAGKQAFPGWSAYCASKFGLLGLSKAVAQEEREHHIRVTAFCPGAVNSSLWDTPTVQADFDRAGMLSVETVAESLVQTVLLPDSAVVDELVLMPSGGAF